MVSSRKRSSKALGESSGKRPPGGGTEERPTEAAGWKLHLSKGQGGFAASGYMGVYYSPRANVSRKPYCARFKGTHLGVFATAVEAAIQYAIHVAKSKANSAGGISVSATACYSLLTAHSSLLTPYCLLLATHSLPLTACYSLLTAHSSRLTLYCSLLATHFLLLTACYSRLTARSSLLTPHSSLLPAHSSLLPAHCSLLTAPCSLLPAHCSLPTAHYSLLPAPTPHSSLLHRRHSCKQLWYE